MAKRKCVLFVHGIGPQDPGYSDKLWTQLWDGNPPADVHKYEVLYYDTFAAMNRKVEIEENAKKLGLRALVDGVFNNSDLAGKVEDKAVDLLRDTVSHVLYYTLHGEARRDILNKFKKQMVVLVREGRAAGDPKDIRIVVLSHSLGTVVSYEALHELAGDPDLGRPAGIRIDSLYSLATPLAAVAKVAGLVKKRIAHVTDEISKPARYNEARERTELYVERWYSYREARDPVASTLALEGAFLDNDPGVEPYRFSDTHGFSLHAFGGYIAQAKAQITGQLKEA